MIKRIFAFLIDIMLVSAFLLPFVFAYIFNKGFENITFDQLSNIYNVYIAFGVLIIFFKDAKDCRSIGKRIMKVKIVSRKNHLLLWQLIIRNVLLVIWPIEVIVMIFRKNHRRIGDMITNTEVAPF